MKIRTAAQESYHADRNGETSGCVFATFVGEWPKKCLQGKHPVALNMFLANSTRFKGQFILVPIYRMLLLSFPHERRLYRMEIIYPPRQPVAASAQGHDNKNTLYFAGTECRVREMRKCITENCGQNHEGGAQPGG